MVLELCHRIWFIGVSYIADAVHKNTAVLLNARHTNVLQRSNDIFMFDCINNINKLTSDFRSANRHGAPRKVGLHGMDRESEGAVYPTKINPTDYHRQTHMQPLQSKVAPMFGSILQTIM